MENSIHYSVGMALDYFGIYIKIGKQIEQLLKEAKKFTPQTEELLEEARELIKERATIKSLLDRAMRKSKELVA